MTDRITTTVEQARRLAVTKQYLSGKLPNKPDAENILEIFRGLGCIQLDPISAVAPSHLIVLWSRLGNFDTAALEKLMWKDKKLFEYWAHQQSIVLTEDYPLYYSMMSRYPEHFVKSWGPAWRLRVRKWLNAHADLRKHVLGELKQKGPLLSRQFEDKSRVSPRGSGWGSSGDVSRMLFNLFFKGEVMVVGRQGKQKLWGISEEFLPRWVSKKVLTDEEVEYEAVQRSIRALGTATAAEIDYHFLRGRYPHLKATLKRLENESKVHQVQVGEKPLGKGERYIHSDDVALLDKLGSDEFEPRLSLLSPFDNLICDRARTRLLFSFDFTVEIYTPSHKRKYGYYVLPILHGDKLIGRLDPLMDRKKRVLEIKAVHAEPKAPKGEEVSTGIRKAVDDLSLFLGAEEVVFSSRVPRFWRSALH